MNFVTHQVGQQKNIKEHDLKYKVERGGTLRRAARPSSSIQSPVRERRAAPGPSRASLRYVAAQRHRRVASSHRSGGTGAVARPGESVMLRPITAPGPSRGATVERVQSPVRGRRAAPGPSRSETVEQSPVTGPRPSRSETVERSPLAAPSRGATVHQTSVAAAVGCARPSSNVQSPVRCPRAARPSSSVSPRTSSHRQKEENIEIQVTLHFLFASLKWKVSHTSSFQHYMIIITSLCHYR